MTLWATFDNAAWRSIQVISCWKSILWWSPWSGCNNPRFLVEIYGGFPINGGTPKTLDGLFHGKSINGWWLGVLPWLRKPPYIYIIFWSLYIYIFISIYYYINQNQLLDWWTLYLCWGDCSCGQRCCKSTLALSSLAHVGVPLCIYIYVYIYVMFVFFRHVITYSITTPKTWA